MSKTKGYEPRNVDFRNQIGQRAAIRGLWKPTCQTECVAPGSVEAKKWDDWLQSRGYPPLARIGLKFDGQSEMPITAAPTEAETIAHRIALDWAEWLRSRA